MFKRYMIGLFAASLLVAWVVPEAAATVRRIRRTVENFHSCAEYVPDSPTEKDLCYGAEEVTDTLYGLDADGVTCTMNGRVVCDAPPTEEFCSEGIEEAYLDTTCFSASATFDLTDEEATNETLLSTEVGQDVCDSYAPGGPGTTTFVNYWPYKLRAYSIYIGENFPNLPEGTTRYELIEDCTIKYDAGGNPLDEYVCNKIWDSSPEFEGIDPPHLPCCGAQFTLTVEIEPAGGGAVTSESALESEINCPIDNCSLTFGTGDPGDDGCEKSLDVVLTAVPKEDPHGSGYAFSGWSGGGCSGTDLTCETSAKDSPTVTASFDVSWYTLTVVVNGDGEKDRVWIKTPRSDFDEPAEFYCYGICYKQVEPGKKITIKRKGGTFGEWEDACSGVPNSEDTCTITMDGNKTAISNFIN